MENNDRIQGVELLANDAEVQADDDAMEEHAKLEDQKGSDLLAEDALRSGRVTCEESMRLDVNKILAVVMRAVVGAGGGGGVGSTSGSLAGVLVTGVQELVAGVGVVAADGGLLARRVVVEVIVALGGVTVVGGVSAVGGVARAGGDDLLDGDVGVVGTLVLLLDVPLSAEVEEEDEHDRSHGDGGRPGVGVPALGHADARGGADLIVGRVEQVDESRGNDDAGTEVAGKQVDIAGDAETGDASSQDREESGQGRSGQDDEEGRDTQADTTIVVVGRLVKIADNGTGVCGVEVDKVGVEGLRGRVGDDVGRHVCHVTLW